jgi:hypothetical protein
MLIVCMCMMNGEEQEKVVRLDRSIACRVRTLHPYWRLFAWFVQAERLGWPRVYRAGLLLLATANFCIVDFSICLIVGCVS